MQPNSLIEWIAIIASLATIISVPFNVIQWCNTATMKRQYYSKIFAEYNQREKALDFLTFFEI
jgi:hypothetical protein